MAGGPCGVGDDYQLIKMRLKQTHGGKKWLSRGRSRDLVQSSRNSDGLGVRLRKFWGCICSEVEETSA